MAGARSIFRGLLWPIRRFFDPRFEGVVQRIDARSEYVGVLVAEARDDLKATIGELHRVELGILDEVGVRTEELAVLLRAEADASSESGSLIHQTLADLLAELEEMRRDVDEIRARLDFIQGTSSWDAGSEDRDAAAPRVR